MRTKLSRYLYQILVVSTVFILTGCASSNAGKTEAAIPQSLQSLYFAETGHTVEPPFLAYYLNHPDPSLLGYPITEALDHEGWHVQYFQYARLEVHPENDPEYFITVGWLGQLSHRTQPPVQPKTTDNYFPETGHTLYGDFRDFYDAHGNSVQFGRPISEPFIHQGRITQDFQSARFIWYPDLPPNLRVELEPIGETYFLSSGLSLTLLDPVPQQSDAAVVQTPGEALPEDIMIYMKIEATPHENIIRIKATFLADEKRIAGYSSFLVWGENERLLPPTNRWGATHTLVDVSRNDAFEFGLYSLDGEVLETVRFLQ